MNQGRYVFSQLMDYISRHEFDKCVDRYRGNHRVRGFTCWHQFLCLMFGQLTCRESLRDIITCLQSRGKGLYHLGLGTKVARSTLSDANQRRDWRIYADYARYLMKEARELYSDEAATDVGIDNTVYALDSSLIHLCLNIFYWAKYRKTTAATKIHTLLDVKNELPSYFCITDGLKSDMKILPELFFEPEAFYVMDRGYMDFEQLYRIHSSHAYFIIPAKATLKFRRQKSQDTKSEEYIMSDQIGVFTVYYSKKRYPDKIRRIRSKDPETGKSIILLTNNMVLSASMLATLYRYRWRIEVFFRWIKQHLRIKVFWGESENAVKTQIWAALCTYLLVAIMKKRLNIQQKMYEILQVLSVSVFDKTPVSQLFTESAIQKHSEAGYNQLSIFDL